MHVMLTVTNISKYRHTPICWICAKQQMCSSHNSLFLPRIFRHNAAACSYCFTPIKWLKYCRPIACTTYYKGYLNGTWTFRTLDYSYHRWTIRTLDCSYRGLFVSSWTVCTMDCSYCPWTFRTLDCSYRGLFVPSWTVRTMDCSYRPWTFCTLDCSYCGLFVPSWTVRTLDYSYHHWTIRAMMQDSQKLTFPTKMCLCSV